MKKFKLLKMYPSLPDEWEVGMEIQQGMDGFYTPVDDFLTFYPLPASEMVDYPEFWEEMEEPEYIIQSFIGGDGRKYIVTASNGGINLLENIERHTPDVEPTFTKEEVLKALSRSIDVHKTVKVTLGKELNLNDFVIDWDKFEKELDSLK